MTGVQTCALPIYLINSAGDFVYDNLPLFLSDEDYQRLDTLLTDENIAALMQKNYSNLISPAGFALKDYLMRDPLGLGSQTLKHLQDFQLESNYELINEHIFSQDGSTMLMERDIWTASFVIVFVIV